MLLEGCGADAGVGVSGAFVVAVVAEDCAGGAISSLLCGAGDECGLGPIDEGFEAGRATGFEIAAWDRRRRVGHVWIYDSEGTRGYAVT
jgi:hypothetical protein